MMPSGPRRGLANTSELSVPGLSPNQKSLHPVSQRKQFSTDFAIRERNSRIEERTLTHAPASQQGRQLHGFQWEKGRSNKASEGSR